MGMKIKSLPIITAAATTGIAGASGGGAVSQSPAQSPVQQSPVQQAKAAPKQLLDVPKGQLGRTRAHIPGGWLNGGNHGGFKSASISQVTDGFLLTAVNPDDKPHGHRK